MSEPHLELRGVEKSYEGGRVRALRGIDLRVERGESLAILGPSGSGKSTLLAVMGGLEQPDAGVVQLRGRGLWDGTTDLAAVRAHEIGFVFQLYNLVPVLNARENVELPMIGRVDGARNRRARAEELLERLGLETRLRTQARFLSGGERQRVALARALANDPDLLLADEPTGALDRENGRRLLAELATLVSEQGKTLVVVTHDVEVARAAGREMHLLDGRFEARGEPAVDERPAAW